MKHPSYIENLQAQGQVPKTCSTLFPGRQREEAHLEDACKTSKAREQRSIHNTCPGQSASDEARGSSWIVVTEATSKYAAELESSSLGPARQNEETHEQHVDAGLVRVRSVSYTHLRAHET